MLRLARPQHRSGFTLVEILVAIGIIITLAAILVVALGNTGIRAREEATAALIRKVSNQVQERLEALDRLKSQQLQWTKDAQSAYGTVNYANTLLLKDRMKLYFPQSFAEFAKTVDTFRDPGYGNTALADFKRFLDPSKKIISNPDDFTTANDFYSVWLQRLSQQSPPMTHDPETESSALLYFELTIGKTLGIPSVDPGEYKASEVADTDGDGLLEFIDAWGKPFRFYRWPTRLIKPDGSAIDRKSASVLINGLPAVASPDPLNKDQDDPTLLLSMASSFNETNYHTPQTYHVFLLVSAGADGQKTGLSNMDDAFGLFKPSDRSNYGHLAQPILDPMPNGKFDALTDNITNRNR